MTTLPSRAARRLSLTLVGILCLTMLAPTAGRAATDLTLGGKATVAYTDGGFVLLRTDPSWDAMALTSLPEGTAVDVLDGPFYGKDGSPWYAVVAWGQEGFLPAGFLVGAGGTSGGGGTSAEGGSAEGDSGDAAAASSFSATVGDTALIVGTNGDGVRCRTEPSYAGGVITVLAEGTSVALNGPTSGAWQAVVCAGAAGYVHVDFVLIDSGYVPQPEPTQPAEQIATQQAATQPAETQTVTTTTVAAATTGYAVVAGTNGDGVRCRSGAGFEHSTITVLPEGTEVALTGAPAGVWQPVVCAGTNGYVHSDYLSTGSAATTPVPVEADTPAPAAGGSFTAQATGYAKVSGTNGGGLRCRSGAGYNAGIITVLAEGTDVALTGAAQGEWQPVTCAGTSGFVHSGYLTYGGTSGGSNSGSNGGTSGGSTGGSTTGSAVVVGTNGGGLRCRSGAGYDAGILTVVAEGTQLALRGAASGAWQPVVCAGMNGFVHTDYLSYGGGGTSGGTSGGSNNGGTSGGGGTATGTATVSGTNGGGLRCRSGASYSAGILVVLSEGTRVTLTGAAQGEWQPVTCAGTSGFVHSGYLTYGGTSGGTSGGSNNSGSNGGSTSGGSGGLAVGSNAMTTANLNLRYEASFSAGVATVAPSGTVVRITGGAVNGFYKVDWDGLAGYMHGDYLRWTDQPLSKRGGSGTPAPTPAPGGTPGGNTGSASGGAIVNFALRYVGYPYVWAGEGPYGFDCSGFVMFVIRNVLGKNITHDMFVQYSLGTPVAYGNLQPGDIVFFQNTFRWGMSHNGIYIGNGQFVHAENESTGVRISDITSQYYSSRYYGAVRFT